MAGTRSRVVYRLINTATGDAPLMITDAYVTNAVGAGRLFDVQLCKPTCGDEVLGFPAILEAGSGLQ